MGNNLPSFKTDVKEASKFNNSYWFPAKSSDKSRGDMHGCLLRRENGRAILMDNTAVIFQHRRVGE